LKPVTQTVISASRRTDIPAFYMKWFMERINKGFFENVNPYNGHVSIVPATPDKIHTIVFWSKNFGPFINGGFGEKLLETGYHLFFNFTVNSDSPLLEPNVPPLNERLSQIKYLCSRFGQNSISWRFDPICFYRTKQGQIKNNLQDFLLISDKVSQCGIPRCITSFVDIYPKIQKRIASFFDFLFIDPPLEKKLEIILKMEKVLADKKIDLYTCCEKELMDALPSNSGIQRSSCISNRLFTELFGGNLSFKKDYGQRTKKGCQCMTSSDIGSYRLHPCFHNCLFCYANPASGKRNSGKGSILFS
jgi:DNA repair photolyase